jgi:hypothetical protein
MFAPLRPALVLAATLFAIANSAPAAVIFESAAKGPTVNTAAGGYSLDNQTIGVRFQLAGPTQITHIGGTFIRDWDGAPANVPASIVMLTGMSDFPDSTNRSTPDHLVNTTISVTAPSADFTTAITPINLAAGWYALTYGYYNSSGANAVATSNNTDIGNPSYFSGFGTEPWFNPSSTGKRMFVLGTPIPEPAGAGVIVALALTVLRRVSRTH